MPVVLVRTGPDRTLNLLRLVNEVRLLCGLIDDATTVLKPNSDEATRLAVIKLNEGQRRLFDRCGKHLSPSDGEGRVVVGIPDYELPSGFLKFRANPHIADMEIMETTEDELRANGCDLEEAGTPTNYYWKAGKLYLWPVPDGTFMADKMVYDNLGWYIATLDHVAGENGTASPTTDTTSWRQIEDIPTLDGADYPWTSGKKYYRGFINFPYILDLTIMVDDNDLPTLPAAFYPALVAYASWQVRAIRGIGSDALIALAESTYLNLELDRIRARRRDESNPRERVDAVGRYDD